MNLRLSPLLLLLCFLTSHTVFANPKKLGKYYQKKNYEKVLKSCEKLIQKGKAEQSTWYYKSASHLKLAAKEKSIDFNSSIFNSISAFQVYDSLGDDKKKNFLIKSISKDLKKKLRANQQDSSENRKFYVVFLATYSKDTIDEYFVFFPVSETEEELVIKKSIFNRDQITFKIPDVIPDGNDIIRHSEKTLKTPWKMGGMTPGKGFDCSGFVIWSYGQCGYELPHKTKLLAKIGKPVPLKEAKVGDIVCFGSKEYKPEHVGHVGMVHSIVEDKVNLIHCGVSTGVIVAPLTEGYWSEVDYFIVRIEK